MATCGISKYLLVISLWN